MVKATGSPSTIRTSSLERAHVDLVRALSALSPPRPIVGVADAAGVLARTEHMQKIYRIAMDYLEAVMATTIDHLPTAEAVDQHEIQLAIWDSVNDDPDYDVVAWLSRAGCLL